ncbi:MAG: hypothetical protein JXQ75_04190 [Phycisphaerae bacterium]|nr:hypothetical protein [Phycisphaerae bacterium]
MLKTVVSTWFAAAAVWFFLPQQSDNSQQEPWKPDRTKPAAGYMREMRYLDLDGDRKIDATELAAGQQMASMMLMLSRDGCDRDGDEAINLAEFQVAAEEAMQALLDADSNSDGEEQAEEALARAVPLKLLLDRLSDDGRYADEVTALRQAVEDMDDGEAVITYITKYPARYPRLSPVVRTWVRHYPVQPRLRRLVKPRPPRAYRPPAEAKPARPQKTGPKAGEPDVKKPPKRGPKPGPKPRKPRPPRRP